MDFFSTAHGGTDSSFGRHFPPSPPLAGSNRVLDSDQQRLFHEIMIKEIPIRAKSGLYATCTKVQQIIEAFLGAYMQLCLLKGSLLSAHHIIVIRGSANVSLLKKKPHDSDIDILYRFATPPTLNASDFRSFSMMLGLQALKLLHGSTLPYSIVNERGTLICSDLRALSLIDKVEGVFTKFVTLDDQSLSIFSLGDVDITFQFGNPKGSLGPRSSSPSDLPPSTATFGHDDIEVIVPRTVFGLVDQTGFPLFSSQSSIEKVERLLSERTLEILNPDMFRGYLRLFYALIKGLMPPSLSQTDKVIRILSQVEQSDLSQGTLALAPLYQFVKEKSKSPDFTLHFFLNAYLTAKFLFESRDRNEGPLSRFLDFLHHDFVHPSWQPLFPDYVSRLPQDKKLLELIALVAEIKAHISLSRDLENRVTDSLGMKIRVVGREDKFHGFYITKSLSFEELLESVTALQSKIPPSIFDEIIDPLLLPLISIESEQKDKFLLLYCMRTLDQESLTLEEFQSFLPLIPRFLTLWMIHETDLTEYDLLTKWKNFLSQYHQGLFSLTNQSLITPLLNDDLSRSNPLLLPSLTYFIVNQGKPIDPALLFKWEENKLFSTIGNYILYFAKLHPNREIFTHIATILQYTQDLYPDLCKLLLQAILNTRKTLNPSDPATREVISYLVKQMILSHDYNLIVQNIDYLEKITLLDIISHLESDPIFFTDNSQIDRYTIMSLILETKNRRLLSFIFRKHPVESAEILENWIESHINGYDSTYFFLTEFPFIQDMLLRNTDWVSHLYEQNELVATRLLMQLIISKPPLEVSPLFSPQLLPLSLQIIQRELLQIREEHLAPLLTLFGIPLLSENHSPGLLATLVTILIKFNQSSTRNETLSKQVLSIYLPHLSRSRREGTMLFPSRYQELIEMIHFDFKEQADLQDVLTQEIIALLPDRIDLDAYIAWALTQPFSDAISQEIRNKLTKNKMISPDQFTLLSQYFGQNKPILLKELITLAEKNSGIERSQIEDVYTSLIPHLGTLETNLGSLKRILDKGYSRNLTLLQIANLKKPTTLSSKEISLLIEFFKKLQLCDTSIKQAFFNQMKSEGFFAEVPSLVPQIIDHIAEDWILFQIPDLLDTIERKDPKVADHLLTKPLYLQGSAPVIFVYELGRFDISLPFISLLSSFVQKTKMGIFTLSEIFPKIEEQIDRLQAFYALQEWPTPLLSLYLNYISIFADQIITSKSPHLSLIFESKMPPNELLTLLPRFITHLSSLSPEFIKKYFYKLAAELPQKIGNPALNKLMSRFIQQSGEKESLELLEIYLKIHPEDPDLLSLYVKVFSSALKSQNIDVLRSIAMILDTRFNNLSYLKKKGAFKDLFEGVMSKLNANDVMFALEITKMYIKSLNLDSDDIAFRLLGILASGHAQIKNLELVTAFIQKTFLEGGYRFSADKTKRIQVYFGIYFNEISPAKFIEIAPLLSHDLIQPYSKSFLINFYKAKGNQIIREIFSMPPSPDLLFVLELSNRIFFDEKGLNPSHIVDICDFIESKISGLIRITPKTLEIHLLIVSGINIYGLLMRDLSKDLRSVSRMMPSILSWIPHISRDHFVIHPNTFYLRSNLNIILISDRFDQINPLVFKVKEYYTSLREDQVAEKKIMHSFILDDIGHMITQCDASFINIQNLIALFQEIPIPVLLMNPLNIGPFIISLMILINFIELTKEAFSSKFIPRPLCDHLQFLLDRIDRMISSSTPLKLIQTSFTIIEQLSSQIAKATNRQLIEQIYRLCIKTTQTILTHPDIPNEAALSAEIIQSKVDPDTYVPIQFVYDFFVNRLTLMTKKLHLISSELAPDIPPIDPVAITLLQHKILLDINGQLIQRNPTHYFAYLLPFTTTNYEDLESIISPLVTPLILSHSPELEEQVKVIKILIGPAIRIHHDISQSRTLIGPQSVDYFQKLVILKKTLQEKIFQLLSTMIHGALSERKYIQEIAHFIKVSFNVLDLEQLNFLCKRLFSEFLKPEMAKPKPNLVIACDLASPIQFLLEKIPSDSKEAKDWLETSLLVKGLLGKSHAKK